MAGNTTGRSKGRPAESMMFLAKKGSAGTIAKGKPVYVSGFDAVAAVAKIELAKADAASTMPCFGFANESITDTQEGNVIVRGVISDIDTSSFSLRDELFVSAVTAGAVTTIKPLGSNKPEKIGSVIRSHASEGCIEVYGGGIAVDSSHDIAGTTEKTAPVSADLLLIEDSAASNAKKKVQIGNLLDSNCYQASATGDITTTATEEVVATGMTLSPTVGEYLVTFSGSVDHNANNASIYLSIYVGLTKVAHSERTFTRGGGQGNVTASFHCQARLAVAVEQSIEGRWKVSSGTGTMHERSLIALAVADPT